MGNKGSLKPQMQKWRRQDGSNLKKPLAAEKRVDLTLMWSVVEVAPMTQQITDPLSTLIASNDFLNHLLKDKKSQNCIKSDVEAFLFMSKTVWYFIFPNATQVESCEQMCFSTQMQANVQRITRRASWAIEDGFEIESFFAMNLRY